ncbi:hypothetical protein [Tianweitania sediminis]|uniref:Uncharacterized protein n=1 Tax=Tianweitania sediminis TaxID=1502156 RepID=A0A8J7R1Y3_9HYPH|nr:hypothetical protein [Tianweitania sediminis]MBP0439982.1 hypothetical protein [Tianweitania sediminis]
MVHNHRSVPCPAHGAAIQIASIGAFATAVAVNAHRDGMAAMRQAREDRAQQLWAGRLQHARVSAANALNVARDAVKRVHELEAEVEALRRAVGSRDSLIRRLADG